MTSRGTWLVSSFCLGVLGCGAGSVSADDLPLDPSERFATLEAAALAVAVDDVPTDGFLGFYYDDSSRSASRLAGQRRAPSIRFQWGTAAAMSGVPADYFSVYWVGRRSLTAGTYRFSATADDGVRVYVDGIPIIDSYKAQAATTYTAEAEVAAGDHLIQMFYFEAAGQASAELSYEKVGASPAPSPDPTPPRDVPLNAFRGSYYNDTTFQALALTRTDAAIAFDWGAGSPGAGVRADSFSVRWEGDFNFMETATYRFSVRVDDGVRVFVDGVKILDKWLVQAPTTYTADLRLDTGLHRVVMEYYEQEYGAVASLSWAKAPSTSPPPGGLPPGNWAHVIQGRTFGPDNGLNVFGHENDNTLIVDCVFDGGGIYGRSGIYMGNVNNVMIFRNTFRNSSGAIGFAQERGNSTHGVTIDSNEFYNHGGHAIWAGRNDHEGVDHTGMRITNNRIHDTGMDPGAWDFHIHAIYIQNNDFLIENNVIWASHKGLGISVRASGVIRGNIVWGSQNEASGYWSDHNGSGSRTLLVENNVFIGDSIGLGFDSSGLALDRFIVRFNTVVMQSDKPAVAIGWLDEPNVEIYGNLLVSTSANFIEGPADVDAGNYKTRSLAGFTDTSSMPYDVHLTASHPARGYASSLGQFPGTDIDGDPRRAGALDAGADQASR